MNTVSSFFNSLGGLISNASIALFCILAVMIDETDSKIRLGYVTGLKRWRKVVLVPFGIGIVIQLAGLLMDLLPERVDAVIPESTSVSSSQNSPSWMEQRQSANSTKAPEVDSNLIVTKPGQLSDANTAVEHSETYSPIIPALNSN